MSYLTIQNWHQMGYMPSFPHMICGDNMGREQETGMMPAGLDNPRVGLLTDVGRRRQVNEDAVLAMEVVSGFESRVRRRFLLVLADGMGGHADGQVASRMVVDAIAEKMPAVLLSDGGDYTHEIARSIQAANKRMLHHTRKNQETRGMGSTAVCAVVDGTSAHIASVGDSRIYVISKREIRCVTKDHSYVQDLIDRGQISEEGAKNHPEKNVITRAVGIHPKLDVDTAKLTLSEDEHLLLCSDGQLIHVEDEELQETVVQYSDPQEACRRLVDMANERGGEDNTSVILLSPEAKPEKLQADPLNNPE